LARGAKRGLCQPNPEEGTGGLSERRVVGVELLTEHDPVTAVELLAPRRDRGVDLKPA